MQTSYTCPGNEWQLIASNIKQGRIRITSTNPGKYYYDIVTTGSGTPSPTVNTGSLLPRHGIDFQFRDKMDVYIYAFDFDGTILFDNDAPYTDMFLQDQATPLLDWYLSEKLGTVTLAVDATVDNSVITLTTGHGVIAGDWLEFYEGEYFLQAEVVSVVTDTITLDMPIDQPFTTAATIHRSNIDFSVDGSITPVVFDFIPGGTNKYDMTRAIVHLVHSSAGDDSKFGDLTALTNGIYFRKHNTVYKNLWNARNNGEFRHRAYDLTYSDKAGGGTFSTTVRRSFAGQDKNGVVVRIDSTTSDDVEGVVRDNLTGLISANIIIQGHKVD